MSMEILAVRSKFDMLSPPKVVSVAKPPWTGTTKNRLQRVIVQIGYGSRGTGWMRSLPCIGHVRIIPRGRKMNQEDLGKVLKELKQIGVEAWITNHDSVNVLEKTLEMTESLNLRNVSVVLLPKI